MTLDLTNHFPPIVVHMINQQLYEQWFFTASHFLFKTICVTALICAIDDWYSDGQIGLRYQLADTAHV